MKKFFLFAAVAGMLASCSSESLTGSDPNIKPAQEERVPILLGVSSPSVNVSRGTTRGTGTVGGVGVTNTDPTNVWYGQRINAFMFTKDKDHNTTLNLTKDENKVAYYDNAVMITPGTTENKIPGQSTATNIGEAMLADGKIQYYPHYGNFDFFGYHGDDAVADDAEITKTDALWTIPFKIDGSQDLMSTKAAPQAWGALTTDQQAKFANEAAYNAFINGTGTLERDFYSAKAARKLIQPVLSFNHLLSRLAFVIKAGNDNAGGWDPTTAPAVPYSDVDEYNIDHDPDIDAAAFAALDDAKKIKTPAITAHQDVDKAVYVKSIEVYSKTTGKMAVAWTADPVELITWDDNGTPAWLALKERPAYYKNSDNTITLSATEFAALPFYYKTADPTIRISTEKRDALPTAVYYYLISDPDPANNKTQAEYDELTDDAKELYAVYEGDLQGEYTQLTASECTQITSNVANWNLKALTPTYPVLTKSTTDANPDDPTPIGEALIVAPSTADYQLRVTISQKVPTNWNTPTVLTEKEETYNLNIPVPVDNPATDEDESGFQANTSYKVVLTVYGFERIVVTTEIKPWDTGAPINVGQD